MQIARTRARRRIAAIVAVSLAASPAGLALVRPVTAAPDAGDLSANEAKDVRTFTVTLADASGHSENGRSTATVTDENEQVRSFSLTRDVSGATSGYSSGTVVVNKPARTLTVQLEGSIGATGALAALSGGNAEATSPTATIPVTQDQYVYTFKWSDSTGDYTETWTEQTHVNPDIKIIAPGGVVKGTVPVPLEATVSNPKSDYASVEFCIDGKTVDTFERFGELKATKTLAAGQHRFVVKVFGPRSAAHPTGEYLGEAERVFLVSGLELTPADGSEVDPRFAAEAIPVALTGVHTISFHVDGKPVFTAKSGPWAAHLELPHTGTGHYHTISAFAYDVHGHLLAHASSKVTVRPAPANQPHAPMQVMAAAPNPVSDPGLAGKPAITSFPADPKNYAHGRSRPITMIVMHKTQGPSVESAANWFANPAAHAAAHYIVDDTQIVQTVPDSDVAWHAGNASINNISLGIEVAGFWNQPVKNDGVYENAAKLVGWLCKKYNITPSSSTIIGHADVPDPDHPGRFGGANNHQDPGGHPDNPAYWDWNKFLGFVNSAYSGD